MLVTSRRDELVDSRPSFEYEPKFHRLEVVLYPNQGGKMDANRELFQLYLLAQMRNQDEIKRALSRLGASTADMAAASQRMNRDEFEGPRILLDSYERLLGEPDERGEVADGELYERRWIAYHLELWPKLRVVVLASPEGVAAGLRFDRSRRASPPQVKGLEDLTPWYIVRADLPTSWKMIVREDWYPVLDLEVPMLPGPEGSLMQFDFGLLQAVHSLRA